MAKRGNPYKRADHFTRAAKERGYPARSVFKLREIDRRVQLFRQGQRVLDLGAAPGSWSLYAAERIGPSGKLLAVDLGPLTKPPPGNVTFQQADALVLAVGDLALFAPYDVVLSDMAPRTTGTREADQAQSFELFSRALELASALLAAGGSFVGKIFMGADFPKAKQRVKELFETERTMRPESTRDSSFEIFLVGLGRRAPT
ncbi:MAG TPA: RlmE family RNA methyltransferase [Polyangiaceae bacterium]